MAIEIPPRGLHAPAAPPIDRPRGGDGEGFVRVVEGLGREIERGERVMHQALQGARAGRDFSAAELIALQAGVYRYSEAVDLASKLVDRTTSGVKTVLQGQ
jgi:hypothetical protein